MTDKILLHIALVPMLYVEYLKQLFEASNGTIFKIPYLKLILKLKDAIFKKNPKQSGVKLRAAREILKKVRSAPTSENQ